MPLPYTEVTVDCEFADRLDMDKVLQIYGRLREGKPYSNLTDWRLMDGVQGQSWYGRLLGRGL